jgi:uncharacterized protein YcbK (DUF882 family)
MKLSENFDLSEFVKSPTAAKNGWDNTPGEKETDSLRDLCVHLLQPLRNSIGRGIVISSGYRCARLNKAVNGAATSQHLKGEASDIRAAGMTSKELFDRIRESELDYDQLILYPTFVHVSYRTGGEGNRKQVLYAKGMK